MQPNYLGSGQLAQNLAGASAFTNFLDQSARRPLENQIVDTTEQNQLAQQQAVPQQLADQKTAAQSAMDAQTQADHMKVLANTGVELDNIKDPAEKAARFAQIKAIEQPNWQGQAWPDQYSPQVQAMLDHAKNQVYGDKIQASRDKIAEEQAKPATPTELARLVSERDALAPDDPNRAIYNAAIQKNSQNVAADRLKVVNGHVIDVSSGKPVDVTPDSVKGGGDLALGPDDLNFMADQYLAGDKSVLQNLGRGAQGSKNVVLLRQAIRQRANDQGYAPRDVAQAMAEFSGNIASQRTLGTRQANADLAVTEFQQLVPIALQASAAVPRTEFKPINQVMQAWESNTGSPEIRKFGAAVNTLVNTYARAISPTGQPTVHDKEEAMKLLSKADSPEAFQGVVETLQQEADAARGSPGIVKRDMREAFVRNPAPGSAGTEKAAPSTPPALTNAQGWTLHVDSQGNKAYVSPDGKQFQEVK